MPSRCCSQREGMWCQRTCKPNSVSPCGATAIPLARTSRSGSSDLPAGWANRAGSLTACAVIPAYLVLLHVGFALRRLLPAGRCALTAPFHPYLPCGGRYVFCGTVRRPALTPASQALPGTSLCGVRTFLPVAGATVRSVCNLAIISMFLVGPRPILVRLNSRGSLRNPVTINTFPP